MNKNEKEIDLSLKETIKTQTAVNNVVKNFVDAINLYKQRIDIDENIFDEDKTKIVEFINKANELAEEWREIDGLIGDFFSAQDELWDENGELKPEYRN